MYNNVKEHVRRINKGNTKFCHSKSFKLIFLVTHDSISVKARSMLHFKKLKENHEIKTPPFFHINKGSRKLQLPQGRARKTWSIQ